MEKFDPSRTVQKQVPDDLCAKVCQSATEMASLCLAGGFATMEVQIEQAIVSFKRLDVAVSGEPRTVIRA